MSETKEQMMDLIAMLKEQVELLEGEITIRSNRYDIIYDKCNVIKSIAEDIKDLRLDMDIDIDDVQEAIPPNKVDKVDKAFKN